jgi:hypothetical protein
LTKKAYLDFDRKKAKLDFDKKKHNYVLNKKKGKKRKHFTEHRVHANPLPNAHTQKPNGGGYA